jgi:hypothetical protein
MDFQFPMTWRELETIVNTGVLDQLAVEYKRSPQLIQTYQNDRNSLSQEENIQLIHKEIHASRTVLSTGDVVALTANKYPYDLLLQYLPGVTHALLWFQGSVSIEAAKAYLQSLGKICCLYENPAALKSIPEVSHYQVFLLNTPASFVRSAAA